MDFTSRQLKAFLLAAQHHSFTRAAEKLFITPSGLSVLIRELERQAGFRLFDRTTRYVALTEHGRQLLPVARRALREIDAMRRCGRGFIDRRPRARWEPAKSFAAFARMDRNSRWRSG